jgi:hypothetical protein
MVKLRQIVLVCLPGLVWISACGTPCEDALGVDPPGHITVIGDETVEVGHIAWECPGFHSDSMDPPPSVPPAADGSVTVEMGLTPGTTVDIRFGNQPVSLDPAPAEGENRWTWQVPEPAEPLVVRLCSAEAACAMYWTNLYPG